MKTRTPPRGLITLLLLALIGAACNDDPTPTPTQSASPSSTPAYTTPGN